ncbi:MAG: pyridoxamine 5'-phosphate oxidase family protein [Sphingomonadales bacterium]
MDPDLETLVSECWRLLEEAAANRGSPLRTPVLASGAAQARTVVLRAADGGARNLAVFTDVRSAKAGQLAADPRACLVFHDPAAGVQLRAWGDAALHHQDEVAQAYWGTLHEFAKRPYQSMPGPGIRRGTPGSGIPEIEDGEAGYPNYLVILVTVTRLEWLRLEQGGNLSARFEWDGAGRLSASWIVP